MRTNLVLVCAALLVGVGCGGGDDAKDTNAAGDVKGVNAAAPGAKEGAPGKTGQAMTIVQGTFAASNIGLDNARVVAIADDQTSYWGYLDAKGDFTLQVPVGFSYRLVFANQLVGGGQVKIGSVVFKTSAGYSEWFGANVEGTLNLGLVATSEASGAGSADSSSTSGSSSHSDDCSCQKDDGSAKKDPSSGNGVNVCLIWPTVILFPSISIDATFGDKGTHVTVNHDDDQTCGYWKDEGGTIIWGAPGVGVGFGYGAIAAGADIGLSGSFGMGYSWSSSGSYSWNSSMGWSGDGGMNASYSSNYSWNYSSSVNYSSSASSSGGVAGTVAIAGGMTLGVAYELNSHVAFGGVIAGGYVGGAGGWALGASSSYEASASGSVCVTAGACNANLSCVAGTCIEH